MVYGRFNPVHLGHLEIFKLALGYNSAILNSDLKIFVTSTIDKYNNPLPYNLKIKMITDYCPEITPYIQNNTTKLFDNLAVLDETYDNIVLLCGSDREFVFETTMNNYNGVLYNFDSIQVINMGDRTTSPYSSTFMRHCVSTGNFESFITCLPDKPEFNKMYFDILSEFMGVHDVVQN